MSAPKAQLPTSGDQVNSSANRNENSDLSQAPRGGRSARCIDTEQQTAEDSKSNAQSQEKLSPQYPLNNLARSQTLNDTSML